MRPLPVAILLAVLPLPVLADDGFAPRFSVTPLLGYRTGGELEAEAAADGASRDVDLGNSSVYGLVVNLPAQKMASGDYTEWELHLSRQTVGVDRVPEGIDPGLELDITHVLLGGTYVGPGELVRPFLGAGIGAAHLSPDAPGYESDTAFAFGIGLGLHLFPEQRIGGRMETRVLGAVTDSSSALLCASGPEGAGCAFRGTGSVLWQWELTAGLAVRF
jgi:opacity protein-like surface antigen